MTDFNARDYMSSTFIKKADLRTGGPRRLTIKAVEEGDGLPGRAGQAPKKELQLVFTDDSRFSLRAVTNLRRMFEAFGERTAAWIGKTIELYFSPDVVNPSGGDPGGIRVRVPEAAPASGTFVSELEAPTAKPNGAAPSPAKRAPRVSGKKSATATEEETAF